MKTRVMQHEPQEPTPGREPVEPLPDEPRPRGIASRMGHWSARHRKVAIFGWLGFVVLAFGIGIVSPMKAIDRSDTGVGESRKADKIVKAAFPQDKNGLGEFVLVRSTTTTVDDPAFRATIDDAIAHPLALPAGGEAPLAVRRRERGADLARTATRR